MIDVSEKAKEEYKKRILEFLAERIQKDPLVAEGCNNPKKNIDDCIKYVVEQARKRAVNNVAFISDEEVFGWVVHYIVEVIEEKPKKKTETKKQDVKEEKPKTVEKPKNTIKQDLQLMFDFGD